MPRSTQFGTTLIGFVSAALLGACGEGTSPDESLSVSLQVASGGASFSADASGRQLIRCEFTFAAFAAGPGSAKWEDATALFFVGRDRSTPLDSVVISRDEARGVWGDTTIASGARQVTIWMLEATVPFSGTLDYRYRANRGPVQTTSATFECGLPSSTSPPAPSVTSASMDAPTSNLEPGGSLTVRYSASSPIGLWHTTVFVSGPCEVSKELNEPLSTDVGRVVTITLPAECDDNVPLTIAVFATDAVGQTTSRHIETSYYVVDRTPPTLTVVANSRFGTGPTTKLSGTYFTGDTIDLQVRARDNRRVQTVLWEAFQGRVRDSMTVGVASTDRTIRLAIPRDWLGPVDVRVVARDPSQLTSAEVVTEPNAVVVYPTVVRPARRAVVDAGVQDVVIDAARGTAYLLEPMDSRVAVLSLAEARITATIPLSSRPSAVDLSAGGDSLVIALPAERSLGVVDLRQQPFSVSIVPLAGFEPTGETYLYALRTAANGKILMPVSTQAPNSLRLLEVDLAMGTQRVRADAGSDPWQLPSRMQRSADHSTIALIKDRCIGGRYDAATDSFIACSPANIDYEFVSLDATGQHMLLGLGLYDAAGKLLKTLDRPVHWGVPDPPILSPDGRDAYYGMASAGIAHVRTSDGRIVERILSPTPGGRLFISPDGRWLVAVPGNVNNSSDIGIIDLQGPATGLPTRR